MATELEIMQHAKHYLDELANGRNPLTGAQLPEDDIVNNVRISRFLFYTSDVLRQVISKGGLHTSQKAKKPFSLTAEQIAGFQYFDQPIFISAITERLNALNQDPAMGKITPQHITKFLEQQGFLHLTTNAQGDKQRVPTDNGFALGISIEERAGADGRKYDVVLYNLSAQHYILDHLDEIIKTR